MLYNYIILYTSFSSCPHSFPAQGLFQWVSSSHQVAKASASAMVLPMNIQDWFSLGLTDLISLLSKRLSRVFSSTKIWKHQFFTTQYSLWFNAHTHTWLLEIIALNIQIIVGKVISLLFNKLSRFLIVFIPKSRHLLISWLQSQSAVIWKLGT